MIKKRIPAVPIKDALLKGEWQRKEEWEHYASLFHCTIVPANDIALSLLKDAHNLLRQSPRYRHTVKQSAKAADRAGDFYEHLLYEESRLNRYGDRTDFLMDYMDSWNDSIKHDIDIFRFSISKYLYKLGFDKENELFTSVFLAHVMLDYSCTLWDMFWATARQNTGKDYSKDYHAARLTSVLNYWEPVSRSLDPKNIVNLDNDPNCKLSFDIIQRKATSADIINQAGEKALDYHDELRKWSMAMEEIHDKEKKRFCEL